MARIDPSRSMRLPQDLHDWVAKVSKEEDRSINSYFVQLVKADKERREQQHAATA